MLVRGSKSSLSYTSALLLGLMLCGTTAIASPPPAEPHGESNYRQAMVGKAWVVGDPALPEETLLAKLSEGEVTRVLHAGRSWDRVEVLDPGHTTGWVLKRLFGPVSDGVVRDALAAQARDEEIERAREARRRLDQAVEDATRAKADTTREIQAQDAVAQLVMDAEKRVAEAQATWKRLTDEVQRAQEQLRTIETTRPTDGIAEPQSPAPSMPVLVQPLAPSAGLPVAVARPETGTALVAPAAPAAVAAPRSPVARIADVVPLMPSSHPTSAPPSEGAASEGDRPTAEPVQDTPPTPRDKAAAVPSPVPSPAPSPPAASADVVRAPSTPESSAASPSEAAGASLVAPPTAIISRDPAAGRPVTVGAGGVTLGGALIALVMVAGLGGFGGWWRRRHGSVGPSMDVRLTSLSSVPLRREVSAAPEGPAGAMHLVDDTASNTRRSLLENPAQRSLRELFPDTTSSPRGPAVGAPVTHEMKRLAAASKRALGGLA